ncbi:MAG TPA: hypothetical protein VEW46_17250 [Pyrinomonadaceae bacterium]|nr:hypothetical protein [Pyrinomonadaceae bacterium]
MPTTNTHKLSLFRVGDNVEMTVQYNAVFTVFERHLAGLGMKFRERIDVIGVDGQPATSEILFSFPNRILPVTDGDAVQTIPRNVLLNVSRAALDEDGSFLGDPDLRNDEIACSVRIQALGLPLAVTPTAFTNQKVLTFDVNAPAAIAAQA